MKSETKLTLIKIIHTAIWIFFNFVIFYMLYAAIAVGYCGLRRSRIEMMGKGDRKT